MTSSPRPTRRGDDSFDSGTTTGVSIASLTSDLSAQKLLLHDEVKTIHTENTSRKKYRKNINKIILVVLVLSNVISIMPSTLVTFIITRDQFNKSPEYEHLPLLGENQGYLTGSLPLLGEDLPIGTAGRMDSVDDGRVGDGVDDGRLGDGVDDERVGDGVDDGRVEDSVDNGRMGDSVEGIRHSTDKYVIKIDVSRKNNTDNASTEDVWLN